MRENERETGREREREREGVREREKDREKETESVRRTEGEREMEMECGLIKLRKIISDDAIRGATSNAVEKIRIEQFA